MNKTDIHTLDLLDACRGGLLQGIHCFDWETLEEQQFELYENGLRETFWPISLSFSNRPALRVYSEASNEARITLDTESTPIFEDPTSRNVGHIKDVRVAIGNVSPLSTVETPWAVTLETREGRTITIALGQVGPSLEIENFPDSLVVIDCPSIAKQYQATSDTYGAFGHRLGKRPGECR